MISEKQQLFLKVITPLFQAQQTVRDSFFNNRLNQEIQVILEKHIIYYCVVKEDQVRHQQASRDYIRALKNIVTLIEEIIYLKKGESIILTIVQERLLFYICEILRDMKSFGSEVSTVSVEIKPQKEIYHKDILGRKSVRTREKRSSSNRNNILEFVRLAPKRRSREVINEFSVLSERTVKRNLKELSDEGLIVKKFENRAVYYSAV